MKCSFTPFPVLNTERLTLRQITLDDDKEIFFQRSDKEMNRYVGNPLAKSIEDAREWITKITNGISNNELIAWGITLKDHPAVMGGFCLWNLSLEHNRGEIGFGIFPAHQQKGYMNEALQEGLRYAFNEMELGTIEAYTHPQNIASVKALERNNFLLKEVQDTAGNGPYIIFELHRQDFKYQAHP